VFLESRYCKFDRELPQTVFFCPVCKGNRRRKRGCERCGGFGKLTRDSVQELLSRRILRAYRARSAKFHGAGREDVDVRMLGSGRPFVFEVVDPADTDVDLVALAERIHAEEGDRVRVAPFVVVARSRVAELKEAKHRKRYRAEVALETPVDDGSLAALAGRELEVSQRTPSRVVRRRADLERRRQVTIVRVVPIGPDRVELELECAHGTYVKEWISGDGGRSMPSFSELVGVEARCDLLDVLEILDGG
jgi:tRNA pseudouridine synthase 10